MIRARPLAMVVLGFVPACADAYDPYSAAVVGDLARHPGDAVGDARSGVYEVGIEPGFCDCPVIGLIPLCAPVGLVESGALYFAEVVEGDGVLLIRIANVELVGSIDAAGTFAIGLVENLDSLASEGELVTRVDGNITALDGEGPRPPLTLHGELVRRVDARVGDVAVACEGRYPVRGDRQF